MVLGVLCLLILAVSVLSVSAQQPIVGWQPMLSHDSVHSSYSTPTGLVMNQTKYTTTGTVWPSPVIASRVTYVGLQDGTFYVICTTRSVLGPSFSVSPSITDVSPDSDYSVSIYSTVGSVILGIAIAMAIVLIIRRQK